MKKQSPQCVFLFRTRHVCTVEPNENLKQFWVPGRRMTSTSFPADVPVADHEPSVGKWPASWATTGDSSWTRGSSRWSNTPGRWPSTAKGPMTWVDWRAAATLVAQPGSAATSGHPTYRRWNCRWTDERWSTPSISTGRSGPAHPHPAHPQSVEGLARLFRPSIPSARRSGSSSRRQMAWRGSAAILRRGTCAPRPNAASERRRTARRPIWRPGRAATATSTADRWTHTGSLTAWTKESSVYPFHSLMPTEINRPCFITSPTCFRNSNSVFHAYVHCSKIVLKSG